MDLKVIELRGIINLNVMDGTDKWYYGQDFTKHCILADCNQQLTV